MQFGKYRDLVQLACTQIQASVYEDHEKEVHAMMKMPYFEIASMLREKNQQYQIARFVKRIFFLYFNKAIGRIKLK